MLLKAICISRITHGISSIPTSSLQRTKAVKTHSDKKVSTAESRVSWQLDPPQAEGELWVFQGSGQSELWLRNTRMLGRVAWSEA